MAKTKRAAKRKQTALGFMQGASVFNLFETAGCTRLPTSLTATVPADFAIEQDGDQYKRTNNAVYVWRAYRTARAADVPIPEWVFQYFDRCALAILGRPMNARTALRALELKAGGGGPSAARRAATADRDRDIVIHVDYRKAHGDAAILAIFDTVAEMSGISSERVRDIYYQARRRRS